MNKELTEAELQAIENDPQFVKIKELMWASWKSAANAHRLYPDSKHSFSDYWRDLGKSDAIAAITAERQRSKELVSKQNTMSNSKEDKQKELEQAAVEYAEGMMGIGKWNDKWYYNDKVMYNNLRRSFIQGANWQSNQQTPTPSTEK